MTEQSLRSNPRLQDLGAHDGICRGSLPQGVLNERQRGGPRASAAQLPRPGLRRPPTRMDCAQRRPAGSPAGCQRPRQRSGGGRRPRRSKVPPSAARTGGQGQRATAGLRPGHRRDGPALGGDRMRLWGAQSPPGGQDRWRPLKLLGPSGSELRLCPRDSWALPTRSPCSRPVPQGDYRGGGRWAGPGRGLLWAADRQRAGSPRQTANGGGARGAGGDAALVGGAARPEPAARGRVVRYSQVDCRGEEPSYT
ncbi:translation initiation factor IF-2-like isoform X2 [Trachypithecus francoisi]|uniref:translation initiation factor IF-2-like isoform X2 n=1 Tax=Trachypithecus francoisi TaxID=54180 RepID=UPI00141B841F|nr:translation initiation factor IF-2-like isoform X2 [Trachypithecus francoisi]